jgi:hypothetical protein
VDLFLPVQSVSVPMGGVPRAELPQIGRPSGANLS